MSAGGAISPITPRPRHDLLGRRHHQVAAATRMADSALLPSSEHTPLTSARAAAYAESPTEKAIPDLQFSSAGNSTWSAWAAAHKQGLAISGAVAVLVTVAATTVVWLPNATTPATVLPVLSNALTFLAIGDWGRMGNDSQRVVAETMGPWLEATNSRFVSEEMLRWGRGGPAPLRSSRRDMLAADS
jgi:hypothetical protein